MDDAKSAIRGIGEEVRRKEDLRLVTGSGCYADDIPARNPLYAIFVHSTQAHARIKKIDVTEARKTPGVVAVLTGKDALADGLKPVPHSTGNSFTGTSLNPRSTNQCPVLVVSRNSRFTLRLRARASIACTSRSPAPARR